jgi:hypothetical protein
MCCVLMFTLQWATKSALTDVCLQPEHILVKKCKPSTIISYFIHFSYILSHGAAKYITLCTSLTTFYHKRIPL